LAKREQEVAKLVAEGLNNRDIAQKLGLSEHTVSNYLFRIYEKLGISGRVELVLYIVRQEQPHE
jgi:DNA-binding NarL/FixJ family response regulator